MEFRALLVNLFNQLSSCNRNALHFIVGDTVPRSIRDDWTSSGSLKLLDSLLEQQIISEQNPDYLINVFDQIFCYDVAEKLKEYKQSQRQYILHTSIDERISSGSLLFSRAFDGVTIDKGPSSPNVVLRQTSHSLFTSVEPTPELQHPLIQSRTPTSSEGTYNFDEDNRKQPSSTIQRILHSKYDLTCIIPFTLIIVFIILSLVVFYHVTLPRKIHYPPSSSIIKQESLYVIQEGLRYGDDDIPNDSFNDANDIGLSYVDRCIGVQVQWSSNSLIDIQFLYSNNLSSSLPMAKNKERFISSSTFMLTSNEEINKINLYQNLHQIVGIQFCTTNKRKSILFGSKEGNFLTESFEHYTFGYTKRWQHTQTGIGRLQFVWIRQMSIKEKIATVPRRMVEMCEFDFISRDDHVRVHAKGIESSWYYLKRKFDRQDPEQNPKASYYEKNSTRGPELFAILNGNSVYYHDEGLWSKYGTGENIICNIIPL